MPFIRYTTDCLNSAQGALPLVPPAPGKPGRPPTAIRVFENGFLEAVSRAHPITPIVWAGPIAAYGLYQGVTGPVGIIGTAGVFAGGWLLWTLIEYFLHRYIFHLPAATPDEKFRFFMVHGYHHDYASDPMRLVAPPMLVVPIAVPIALAYHALLGAYWLPTYAGTLIGYVAYDWIHYYSHHVRPTSAVGKWMRRYHMEHHYLDHDAHYGVSSPLWDYVFRTHRARRRDKPVVASAPLEAEQA